MYLRPIDAAIGPGCPISHPVAATLSTLRASAETLEVRRHVIPITWHEIAVDVRHHRSQFWPVPVTPHKSLDQRVWTADRHHPPRLTFGDQIRSRAIGRGENGQ